MPRALPVSYTHLDVYKRQQQVVDWATPRSARLLLVNDSHRLSDHVQVSAEAFAALLQTL